MYNHTWLYGYYRFSLPIFILLKLSFLVTTQSVTFVCLKHMQIIIIIVCACARRFISNLVQKSILNYLTISPPSIVQ